MPVAAQPQKIMRSVFGHLAAAAVDGYGQWKDHAELRDWFLSGSGRLPTGIKIHYWLYPFKPQVIVRGFGFSPALGRGSIFVGWVLKFFPVAFLIVTHKDGHVLDLPDLSTHDHLALDDTIDLPLNLRPLVHPDWPEAYPGENGIILSGQHAMRAVEKRIVRRR